MNIEKGKKITIGYFEKENKAVTCAACNLSQDIYKATGCISEVRKFALSEKEKFFDCDILIASADVHTFFPDEEVLKKWEGYVVKEVSGKLYINGADRRGTIYGIYTVSSYIGVSPWYYFADVPVKKCEGFVFPAGYYKADYPSVQYRGIFLNDEEELDEWAKKHTSDGTIGPETYVKVYELILRLKGNLIWPAMHVNYFQENPENARLADEMGIVVGTSHCDMLMRSNQNEWNPWLRKNGYKSNYNAVHSDKIDGVDMETEENKEEIFYDYSIPGKNREELIRYWRESVAMNRDYEVCYTIGMRGVHDYGFVTSVIDADETLSEEEKKKEKIKLLEKVMTDQRALISEELGKDAKEMLQSFVPYKEVLDLYDGGLKVPDDVALIWVDDNFGYIRRYPNEDERQRSGGHGLYYHASYWAVSDMSYLFLNSIPLAHMTHELSKAYESGIQKMWVLNVGALKPIEMEMEAFITYGWDAGKNAVIVNDIHAYTASWFKSLFSCEDADMLAKNYEEFAQLTNARKIEHMASNVFTQAGYGDEAGYRICRLRKIMDYATEVYDKLPEDEKESFFELFLFKVQASYFVNAAFYYADRSVISYDRGNNNAADYYSDLSQEMMRYLRSMLYYYNKVMCDGKWDKIMTPDDFPPPGICFYPPKRPSIKRQSGGVKMVTWDGNESTESGKLSFYMNGTEEKWFELGNQGIDEVEYNIICNCDWIDISDIRGNIITEKRIYVKVKDIAAHIAEKCELIIECNGINQKLVLEVEVSDDGTAGKTCCAYEADGAVCIFADEFCKEKENLYESKWKKIYGLGRGSGNALVAHGSMSQGSDPENDFIKYNFYLINDGEHELEVTRYLTLDSRGRVRFGVSIDDNEPFIVESDITDEWRGDWKGAVHNNGEKLSVKLGYLEKGYHTIKLYMIDNYVTIHKLVIYTQGKKKSFFGPQKNISDRDWHEPYCEELVQKLCDMYHVSEHNILPDLVYTDKTFWNYNRIYMKNDKVKQTGLGKNYYSDYYKEKSVCDITKMFGHGVFMQKDSYVAIDAECALEESDNAYRTAGAAENDIWQHVRSETCGGKGLAMQVDKCGRVFSDALLAPGLHYKFSIVEENEYNLWMLMLFEDHLSDIMYIAIDDRILDVSELYSRGRLFTYGTAHIYFWNLICTVSLTPGIHKLSIYSGNDGIQVDRIYITSDDGLPPSDETWIRADRR